MHSLLPNAAIIYFTVGLQPVASNFVLFAFTFMLLRLTTGERVGGGPSRGRVHACTPAGRRHRRRRRLKLALTLALVLALLRPAVHRSTFVHTEALGLLVRAASKDAASAWSITNVVNLFLIVATGFLVSGMVAHSVESAQLPPPQEPAAALPALVSRVSNGRKLLQQGEGRLAIGSLPEATP